MATKKSSIRSTKKPSAQSAKTIDHIAKIIDNYTGWMVGWHTTEESKKDHQILAAQKIFKYLSK